MNLSNNSSNHGFIRPRLGLAGAVLLLVMVPAAAQVPEFVGISDGSGGATLTEYNGPNGAVVIPDTLPVDIGGGTIEDLPTTGIFGDADSEEGVFTGKSITSVTIPATVTNIGPYAFDQCNSLTSLTILTNNITTVSIGDDAFEECTSLTNFTLPDSVVSLGNLAFAGCGSLTSVTIPSSVTSANCGSGVFEACTNLTSVSIPNTFTSIPISLFEECPNLTTVTIPASVTTIGNTAFNGTGLTSVTLPGNVTTILSGAFSGCPNLTSVTFPNSLATIGSTSFQDDPLTSVTIPPSVTSLGLGAFEDCTHLTVALFQGNAPTMGGEVFQDVGHGFTVEYYNGAIGFMSPTWTTDVNDSYPAVNLGIPPPFITSANATTFTVNQAGTFTMTATGNPAPTFTATGLPSWAHLSTAGVLTGTPPDTTDAPFTINVTAANGTLPNATQVFTLNVIPATMTFSQWEAQYPQLTNLAPTATPENDGVPTLLKYLYDINPSQPMLATDRAALPVFAVSTTTGNLTLTYRQYSLETGITINVQTSPDLQTWTPLAKSTTLTSTTYTVQPVGSPSSNGDQTMEVDVMPTGTVRQFIRLNVTQP